MFQDCNFTAIFNISVLTLKITRLHKLLPFVRPSFRAKWLHLKFQNCNSTPVFDTGPHFVKGDVKPTKFAFHHMFARPTRTIYAEAAA